MRLLLLLTVLMVGCSSRPFQIGESDPSAFDEQQISVSGLLVVGDLEGYDHFYLCPTAHAGGPNGTCIDVIAKGALADRLRHIPPDCVTPNGQFKWFAPDIVTTGYLRSKIGLIKVRSSGPCRAR